MAVQQLEARTVTAERVNEHGIKADGEWLNISKYAEPADVVLPAVGETVRVEKAGFIRKIERLTPPTVPVDPVTPATTTAPTKDQIIVRLAVLNPATALTVVFDLRPMAPPVRCDVQAWPSTRTARQGATTPEACTSNLLILARTFGWGIVARSAR